MTLTVDAVQDTGENLNEQLNEPLDRPNEIDEMKKMEKEFCSMEDTEMQDDMEDTVIITEEYMECHRIMPEDEENAKDDAA